MQRRNILVVGAGPVGSVAALAAARLGHSVTLLETQERIDEFDFERLRGETDFPFVVQTEQHKLANMALARLRSMPHVEVFLGTGVTGLEQDERQVTVKAGE